MICEEEDARLIYKNCLNYEDVKSLKTQPKTQHFKEYNLKRFKTKSNNFTSKLK